MAKKAKKTSTIPKESNDSPDTRGPGQPTKYTADMPDRLRQYIADCPDDAKLPTRAGFACFVRVDEDTLANWGKVHVEFFGALGELKAAQHRELQNRGLLGSYNSTIAKLLLMSVHDHVERRDNTSKGESITPQIVSFAECIKQEPEPDPKPDDDTES